MDLSKLKAIAKGTSQLLEESKINPMTFWRPTKIQEEVLRDKSRLVLLRGGNQIGKTAVGAYETICHCIGAHPHKPVPPPPIEAWVICHSWEQSRTIMGKFHDLVPKGELHPDVEFTPGKGYRGTGAPVVRWKNGSIVRFKTTNQGTLGLAMGS